MNKEYNEYLKMQEKSVNEEINAVNNSYIIRCSVIEEYYRKSTKAFMKVGTLVFYVTVLFICIMFSGILDNFLLLSTIAVILILIIILIIDSKIRRKRMYESNKKLDDEMDKLKEIQKHYTEQRGKNIDNFILSYEDEDYEYNDYIKETGDSYEQ